MFGVQMIRCEECNSIQADGALFCSECGASLLDVPERPTNILPFSRSTSRPTPPPLEAYQVVTSVEAKPITFVIAGYRSPVVVEMAQRVLIGRADVEDDVLPELDLTDFDGLEKGVSRTHAALEWTDQGIVLIDLDSTNGTSLNGNPVAPQQAFLLQTGDEIRLGDLLFHVFFDF
jgi:pSer/pThr/pTyr-binding forkhead associated (FHA) protein